MYNKVILVGNLTRDVEVRYSQSGSAIANVGIATSHKFKSNGEQKEEVMFIDVTLFSKLAEIANSYLRKGSKVLIEGRLQYQKWVAQDGTNRSKHIVVAESMKMLDSRDSQSNNSEANSTPQQPNIPEIDIDEDEI